jgi:hypothetical protein
MDTFWSIVTSRGLVVGWTYGCGLVVTQEHASLRV